MSKAQVGLIGLGQMGLGLAKNLVEKNFEVIAWDEDSQINLNPSNSEKFDMTVCENLRELSGLLKPPRSILLSIPSGSPVSDVITQLTGLLSQNDVVADCGNSYFQDTQYHENQLRQFGLKFLGIGISGGPAGARTGPSIMAGGSRSGWSRVQHCFEAISAKVEGDPCCTFFGQGGSGHFVKMIHNGIEYGVMHLLLEVYAILCRTDGNDHQRMAEVFTHLNSGQTASYLMGVTARVLTERRFGQDSFLIDEVDGRIEQKGTGQWTVKTALDLGVPVPTICEAVMFRQLSGMIKHYTEPVFTDTAKVMWFRDNLTELQDAVLLAFVSTFAQGMSVLMAGKEVVGNELDLGKVLQTWRAGCVLQGALIDLLTKAVGDLGEGQDILQSAALQVFICRGIKPLRRLTADAISAGIPCSGLVSALAYIESKRGSHLSTSLTQLQRHYFGRHPIYDKMTGEPIKFSWKR